MVSGSWNSYQSFGIDAFNTHNVRYFALQLPGTLQWISSPTRALIHVRHFRWCCLRYRCNPRPQMWTQVHQSRKYGRSVINPPVTCRSHRMSNIYAYTIVVLFARVRPVRAFCTLFCFPRLTCMDVAYWNRSCLSHGAYYPCSCVLARHECPANDRECAHPSRPSRGMDMKCGRHNFHGRINLDRQLTERALHAGHVYLCTQIFPRRRLCAAVVASPKKWLAHELPKHLISYFLCRRTDLG